MFGVRASTKEGVTVIDVGITLYEDQHEPYIVIANSVPVVTVNSPMTSEEEVCWTKLRKNSDYSEADLAKAQTVVRGGCK